MNVRKILCATDFSEASLAALAPAAELSTHFGAELLLLHVVPYGASAGQRFVLPEEAEAFTRNATIARLQQLAQERLGTDFQVSCLFRIGDADVEIVRAAEEEGADLLVMASHGQSGWRSVVFGSVTESVLRQSRLPVWTIHAAEEARPWQLKTILCPTDFSRASINALNMAVEWATEFGAELCLLHVLPPMEPVLGIVSFDEFEAARYSDAAQTVREMTLGRVPKAVEHRTIIKTGAPSDVILDTADEINADAIVIATHGKTGWRHLVFGSVVEAVVRSAKQPVLTVHNVGLVDDQMQMDRTGVGAAS